MSLLDVIDTIQESKYDKPWMKEVTFLLLDSLDSVKDYLNNGVATADYIAIDLETTGLNVKKVEIVGMSFSYRDNECAYIPLKHLEGRNVPYEDFIEFFKSIIPKVKWVWFNAKYDTEVLYHNGVNMNALEHFEDAMVPLYLHDSNAMKFAGGLKSATKKYIGKEMISFNDLFPELSTIGEGAFNRVDPKLATRYAGSDALFTREIYEMFKHEKEGKQKFIYLLETKLIDVVRKMERNGVQVDVQYFETLKNRVMCRANRQANNILEECEKFGLERHSVNLESSQQMGKIFFEVMKIPNPYKTGNSGQFKTDSETMDKLAKETGNQVLLEYSNYKKTLKLLSSYISPFLLDPNLEIGHVAFKQLHVPTGRFACGGGGKGSHYLPVNFQSMPSLSPKPWKNIKKLDTSIQFSEDHFHYEYLFEWQDELLCYGKCEECPFSNVCKHETIEEITCDPAPNIRRGIITRRPDTKIFTVDFSGVELRIGANLSGERSWIDEFVEGEGDLHTMTAMNCFNLPKEDILADKGLRGVGKTVNFGAAYGAGPGTLMGQINGAGGRQVTVKEAGEILNNFWKGVPQMDKWRQGLWLQGEMEGEVYTYFGRKRPVPESQLLPDQMDSPEEAKEKLRLKGYGDRTTVNHSIQGTAADIMKMAMLKVQEMIEKNGWEKKLLVLLTVHDELVFECDVDILSDAMRLVSETMAVKVNGWEVPFETDIELSNFKLSNWGMTEEYRILEDDGKAYPSKLVKGFKQFKKERPDSSMDDFLAHKGMMKYSYSSESTEESSFSETVVSESSTITQDSVKPEEPPTTVVSDVSNVSIQINKETIKGSESFFNMEGHTFSDRLVARLNHVFNICPGHSTIHLGFKNNLVLEKRGINLKEFTKNFNLFFAS